MKERMTRDCKAEDQSRGRWEGKGGKRRRKRSSTEARDTEKELGGRWILSDVDITRSVGRQRYGIQLQTGRVQLLVGGCAKR